MIAPEVIQASEEFRSSIISALLQTDWLQRYGQILQPEHFQTKDEQTVVRAILEYYDQYHAIPSELELQHLLGDQKVERYYNFTDQQIIFAADQALDFAKQEAMRIAILRSAEALQKGDMELPMTLVREALAVGADSLELGQDLVEDVTDWLYEEYRGRRYPTGWQSIDNILDGGLSAGEYGLIMAPPNSGKTSALINIGYGLAGLVGGCNVLHITLEMAQSKILKRYATRMTGLQIRRDNQDAEMVEQIRATAMKRLRGKLRVIYLQDKRVQTIRTVIDNLKIEGFNTEALIVDYADLLHTKRRSDRRFELEDISRDLRDMGNEYQIPVWSATQAGRQAFTKETITMADVAEAIGKAAIADVIISLCQTKDEKTAGTGRLFLAKMRDGEAGKEIPVAINFAKQTILELKDDL